MNARDISDSLRIQDGVDACEQCGSTARVGRGFCLNCMLNRAMGSETETTETLDDVLDEIDVRDADWRIGNYQILEEIGRGGMGVIYRARQRHSRRIVALKRILSYQAESQETLVRFRREAEAAASLDHPNILPIYEVSESDDGLPFFTMKFAAGGSLLDAARGLRHDPRRIIALLAKVSRAVQYAHLQGILHRDLKPGNILLGSRGEPLVTDFGLAKWLDTSSDLTRTLTVFGTPGYIAPEQAHGPAKNLTPAADTYSIGAILFDLFTGRTPFLGEHALAVIKQASEKPAPKLRTLAPLADRDVETICAKCLEREPEARYRSAGDLAEDLERWLEGRPIVARPVSPPARIWRWSKRNPKLAGCIATCLVLGAAVGTFQLQNYMAARAATATLHSVAVESLLDLDTAQPDLRLSAEIAKAFQSELSRLGPARVTAVSDERTAMADSGSPNDEMKARWQGARTTLQGTKRILDRKFRLSLRLIDTADGKVVYRQIVESEGSGKAAESAAKLTAAKIYSILSMAKLSPIQSTEIDPGWRDENTRELLIAGRAVMERRTLVDINRAIELFKKAIEAEPKSALAYSYLADAQAGPAFFTGDLNYLSGAEQSAKVALNLKPTSAEAHKALCIVLFLRGRFRESLEEAFTAYELADSEDDRLSSRVAANFQALGQLEKAVAWYRLGIGKSNRPAHSEFLLADCLSDLGDDNDAAALYQRTSALFPELPEGWMGLCRLALLQKNFDGAHKISSQNQPHYGDFVSSSEMAAQVEFFSRNFSQAEKLYQELAAKDPNGGGSFYGAVTYQSALGLLRLAAHDEENGKRILESALKKQLESLKSLPQDPRILYCVAAIEAALGKIEPALEHLRRAMEAGWIDYRSMELDPRFDAISGDPRFRGIIRMTQTKVQRVRQHLSQFRSEK